MQWKDAYTFGEPRLDGDHHAIFTAIQELTDLTEPSREDLAQAIEKLIFYATDHVEREEAFMASLGYSGMEKHLASHSSLQEELTKTIQPVLRGRMALQDFTALTMERFIGHVMIHDLAFAEWRQAMLRVSYGPC